MFGLFKNKDKNKSAKNTGQAAKKEGAVDPNEPLDREAVKARAMENARAARESIGEETLHKIAAALQAKQNSAAEQAKQQISSKSPQEVAEEILALRRGKYE